MITIEVAPRLSDVSFTADVDHVLARAAIAHKRREIIDALTGVSVEVEPLLRDLRDRLNAGLSDHRLAPGVALRGHVETMRVNDISSPRHWSSWRRHQVRFT